MNTSTMSLIIRLILAVLITFLLCYHGVKKKSLSISGCTAAAFVGFTSFACSYRFGLILILFYYFSSKLTKYKQEVKAKLEEEHSEGGQRDWKQVLACSVLATLTALLYAWCCGEDRLISFSQHDDAALLPHDSILRLLGWSTNDQAAAYLWSIYIAHYATATADTWASELGMLSASNPRMITCLWLREVPKGTNGGMSLIGTGASAAGGLFIGIVYWIGSFFISTGSRNNMQYPMIVFSTVCGILGSIIDSLLGATLQATYYSKERKCIVKSRDISTMKDNSIECISGVDLLSNEAVNLLSTLITMLLALWIAPMIFCFVDSEQCYEMTRTSNYS